MKHLDLSFDWLKMLFFDVLCWIFRIEKWSKLRRESNGIFKICCRMRRVSFKLPDLFWMWVLLAGIALVAIPTLIYCAHKVLTAFNL